MTLYEFTNDQRRYFGLTPVAIHWEKQSIDINTHVYFEGERIVKILNYSWGYMEYDTNIDTKDRLILLPKTLKGKQQKLTAAKLSKIKGSHVQFSASFAGGVISVYDNKRNVFFITSFPEQERIKSFDDIDNWISKYVSQLPDNYFSWLENELVKKRLRVKVKQGDVIGFKISKDEYGFARILSENYGLYSSVVIAAYAYYKDNLQIDIDSLIKNSTLPAIRIFDIDIYRGAMPIIGHKALTSEDKKIQFPSGYTIALSMPYTKKDIENFLTTNS